MRIQVDLSKCTGIGLCEAICPDSFEVDDGGKLQLIRGDGIPDGSIDDVDAAIMSCPTGALSKQP